MKRINIFLFFTAIIYFFSFSGITVGDIFFRSLENGYPLFIKSNFFPQPVWMGFFIGHILVVPTIRLVQLILAGIGLLPSPLLLQQLINIGLAVLILKLFYSILLKLNLKEGFAILTTVFFAFTFAFYANLNAEQHHFATLLFVFTLWLIFRIKIDSEIKQRTIFLFFLCLLLLPLYHIENIIYSAAISLYFILNKDLRAKIRPKALRLFLGAFSCVCAIVLGVFIFHYCEVGGLALKDYLPRVYRDLRIGHFNAIAVSAYSKLSLNNFYIMLRSQLESFSIISRSAKIIQYFYDIAAYSGKPAAVFAICTVIFYLISFAAVNLIALFYIIKKWKNVDQYLKFLISLMFIYLFGYGLFLSGSLLLSEFFITSVLLQIIILGYIFNSAVKKIRIFFYLLLVLTILSNYILFIYPQKFSAVSLNKIFTYLENKDNPDKIVIVRVGFLYFPYEASLRKKIEFYFDEHAYDSKEKADKYLNSIKESASKSIAVYLIGPEFLLGPDSKINFSSAIATGMDKENIIANLKYFMAEIKEKHKLVIQQQGGYYNFGTLGLLGKLTVVKVD